MPKPPPHPTQYFAVQESCLSSSSSDSVSASASAPADEATQAEAAYLGTKFLRRCHRGDVEMGVSSRQVMGSGNYMQHVVKYLVLGPVYHVALRTPKG